MIDKEHKETLIFVLSTGHRIKIKMNVKELPVNEIDITIQIGNETPVIRKTTINNRNIVDNPLSPTY